MVALVLPHPTVDAIDAHYAAHQSQRQPLTIGPRTLAGCERAGWYAFRWANAPREFAALYARANLSRGEAVNELVQCLSDIGVHVQRVDPTTYQAMEATELDGHYRQKVAGIATGLLESPKTEHLIYIDLQKAAAFKQITTHGFSEWAKGPAENRIISVQVGMHILGLTRAFYLVKNKDTDELWSERIEYDPAHAIALLAKAARIRGSDIPPARINDDPQSWSCRNCPSVDLCHHGKFAIRTCRTCLHSTTAGGGRWHCARHDRDLTRSDQEQGCPHHLYLPGLVPGTPDDADEAAETVTYVLPSGKLWVDGAERGAAVS